MQDYQEHLQQIQEREITRPNPNADPSQPVTDNPAGKDCVDRSSLAAEFNDPNFVDDFCTLVPIEVGYRRPECVQMLAESIANRALAVGTSMRSRMRDCAYWGAGCKRTSKTLSSAEKGVCETALRAVASGRDTCNYCTDNASNQPPGNMLANNRLAAGNTGVWCDLGNGRSRDNGGAELFYINEKGSNGRGVASHAKFAKDAAANAPNTQCGNATVAQGTGKAPPGSETADPATLPNNPAPQPGASNRPEFPPGPTESSQRGAGKYENLDRDPKAEKVAKSCGGLCNCTCQSPIEGHHRQIRAHKTDEFIKHRNWMIDEFFTKHILDAMGMMTSQLSAIAVQQTKVVGKFFDAKHQLETQRLFQQLMAEAHKDYQPSEGMCEIGTNIRSLATSSRKSDLGYVAFANRVMARQLRNGDNLSSPSENSDIYSRIDMFVKNHCNKADNSNGLNFLCAQGGDNKERMNKDVDFTRTIESQLTLDIDFTDQESEEEGAGAGAGNESNEEEGQPDAEDVFALTANLFAHNPFPAIARLILATPEGIPKEAAYKYIDLRSVAAKRSVAQNSFTAMTAERAKGDKEAAPYLKKLVTELGVKEDEVEDILGKEPSYFAQMEVLSKDIYQNPVFYTELYDKPANVLRKGTAIRAINLMQDRDHYKSQLRSEAALAVLLETMLAEEHNRVNAQLVDLEPGGQ